MNSWRRLRWESNPTTFAWQSHSAAGWPRSVRCSSVENATLMIFRSFIHRLFPKTISVAELRSARNPRSRPVARSLRRDGRFSDFGTEDATKCLSRSDSASSRAGIDDWNRASGTAGFTLVLSADFDETAASRLHGRFLLAQRPRHSHCTTLSEPFTLRLEPSAYLKKSDARRFVRAMASLCEAMEKADIVPLSGFHVGHKVNTCVDYSRNSILCEQEKPASRHKVAFLGHLLLDEHVLHFDPSLEVFDPDTLITFLDKVAGHTDPMIFDQVNVRSTTGDQVHLSFVGLNLTSRQIVNAMKSRNYRWIMDKIEDAVLLARDAGCQVVGFGGFTSIISGNCRRVKTNGVGLTTGNSLTIGMGIRALEEAASRRDIDLERSSLAVIGATGNIASTYAVMMAPHVAELVLVVRDLESPKLKPVLADIRQAAPDVQITVADSVEAIDNCSAIVAASNAAEPLIYPHHLSPDPVVICDISLPADVAEEVSDERPDVLVIHGGVVKPPFAPDFSIGGIPLARGHMFACMGETVLMGLEGQTGHGSYGTVCADEVRRALAMADKHGFALGDIEAELPHKTAMSSAYVAHVKRNGSVSDS